MVVKTAIKLLVEGIQGNIRTHEEQLALIVSIRVLLSGLTSPPVDEINNECNLISVVNRLISDLLQNQQMDKSIERYLKCELVWILANIAHG